VARVELGVQQPGLDERRASTGSQFAEWMARRRILSSVRVNVENPADPDIRNAPFVS
jgi:hypothetical protein